MDVLDYLKFLAALVFVLALIGALAYFARRHGWGGMVAPMRGRDRRLSLIESLPIDPRHRLILARRDNVEYVLLVGNTNLIIEQIVFPSDTEKQDSSVADLYTPSHPPSDSQSPKPSKAAPGQKGNH